MRYASLALAPLLAGCFPLPHRVHDVPEVSGVVTLDGRPIAGVSIYYHQQMDGKAPDSSCGPSDLEAITDSDGRFYFEPHRKLQLFIVIGDPAATWGLCIKHGGKMLNGWRAYGIGVVPAEIELLCELSDDSEEFRDGGFGVCTRRAA